MVKKKERLAPWLEWIFIHSSAIPRVAVESDRSQTWWIVKCSWCNMISYFAETGANSDWSVRYKRTRSGYLTRWGMIRARGL